MFPVQTHNSFSTACPQSVKEKKKKKPNTDSFTSEPTSHSAEPGAQDSKRSLLTFTRLLQPSHQKPHGTGLLPATRWTLWAFRGTVSPSAGVRQPTAGGGMLWVALPPWGLRARGGCLLFFPPHGFPSLPVTAQKPPKSTRDTQIMTSHQTRPACVCVCVFSRGVCVWRSRPCLKLDLRVCVCAHLHSPTHDTDFPQRSCALTGRVKGWGWGVRGRGARFFF